MAVPALAHRVTLKPELWVRQIEADDVIARDRPVRARAADPAAQRRRVMTDPRRPQRVGRRRTGAGRAPRRRRRTEPPPPPPPGWRAGERALRWATVAAVALAAALVTGHAWVLALAAAPLTLLALPCRAARGPTSSRGRASRRAAPLLRGRAASPRASPSPYDGAVGRPRPGRHPGPRRPARPPRRQPAHLELRLTARALGPLDARHRRRRRLRHRRHSPAAPCASTSARSPSSRVPTGPASPRSRSGCRSGSASTPPCSAARASRSSACTRMCAASGSGGSTGRRPPGAGPSSCTSSPPSAPPTPSCCSTCSPTCATRPPARPRSTRPSGPRPDWSAPTCAPTTGSASSRSAVPPAGCSPAAATAYFYRIVESVLEVRKDLALPHRRDSAGSRRPHCPRARWSTSSPRSPTSASSTCCTRCGPRANPMVVVEIPTGDPRSRTRRRQGELALRLWRADRDAMSFALTERGIAVIAHQPGETLDLALAPLLRTRIHGGRPMNRLTGPAGWPHRVLGVALAVAACDPPAAVDGPRIGWVLVLVAAGARGGPRRWSTRGRCSARCGGPRSRRTGARRCCPRLDRAGRADRTRGLAGRVHRRPAAGLPAGHRRLDAGRDRAARPDRATRAGRSRGRRGGLRRATHPSPTPPGPACPPPSPWPPPRPAWRWRCATARSAERAAAAPPKSARPGS